MDTRTKTVRLKHGCEVREFLWINGALIALEDLTEFRSQFYQSPHQSQSPRPEFHAHRTPHLRESFLPQYLTLMLNRFANILNQ
jgi:hypothetical protein